MTDSNNLPPDRISIHPFSEFFDETALSRGIGIRFKGQQRSRNIAFPKAGSRYPPAKVVTVTESRCS